MPISSYIEEVFDFYRQTRIRRAVKAITILVVLVAFLLLEVFPSFLTTEATILTLVVIAMVSLELVETKLYDIEAEVTGDPDYRVFKTPRLAYATLTDYIDPTIEDEKAVYMINYIGRADITRDLITTAVEEDYHIYLLLKYPDTLDDSAAIDNDELNTQVSRFVEQTLPPAFFNEYEHMSIRFYRYPATVSGIKIADEGLGIGWYSITEPSGQPRTSNPENYSPTFVFTAANEDYDILNEWFQGVFADLWTDAETLADIYEERDSEELTNWVEYDPENRQDLITEISADHPESRADLFD